MPNDTPQISDSVQRFDAPSQAVKEWAADPRPYIIHAENLEKIYDIGTPRETKALRGVNLDISLGEIVVIFGSSGSGKSTLLNILAALDKPTAGKIVVDGKDLAHLKYEQEVEYHQLKIGMVFQSYNLIPNLTVMQNITMPARLAGFKRSEYIARGRDILKQFELEKVGDRLASNLSGGQQQRVAIMRSLMNRPAMIIADEPTGNLDSENSRMMMNIFKRLNEETTTTMAIVSHDPSLFEIADRVVHIRDGKVIKQTILSLKAKVDPKTIDVPVEYRLTKEEKDQLLRELGAKTAYKDKNKAPTPAAGERQVDKVREQAKTWQLEEEAMKKIKQLALARRKAKARQKALEEAAAWALAEQEMAKLKTISLQRVRLRLKKEAHAMEQIKIAALNRVRVRRHKDEAEVASIKEAAKQRLADRHSKTKQHWQTEEAEVADIKKAAKDRLKAKAKEAARSEASTWSLQEKEMETLKHLALARLQRKAKQEQQRVRETIHRAARTYSKSRKGKKSSSFARLVTEHKKLEPEEQRILALLLVLLDRKQQDSLSDQQIWRLFFAIHARLTGEFDYSRLLIQLDVSEKDGGVGLYRQTAEHVATGVETMLQLQKK